MFQKRCFRIGVLASILMCGLLVGCGPSAEEQAATSAALTATADAEWTIPADFDTYTDESSTFSISYPSDWEVDLSGFTEAWIFFEEWLESMDTQLEVQGSLVFFVGAPCGIDCLHPTCNIVVGGLTGDIKSIEEYSANATLFLKSICEEYHEISRETTIIDGRESVITEFEATVEGFDFPVYTLNLETINGDMAWTVGCAARPDLVDYAELENVFQNIVRSLKLHY